MQHLEECLENSENAVNLWQKIADEVEVKQQGPLGCETLPSGLVANGSYLWRVERKNPER